MVERAAAGCAGGWMWGLSETRRRGDFTFLSSAAGRTQLPFTELSGEIFLTASGVDRQGLAQFR